ncbi:hypothetical protein DFH06DRAFT_1154914 [Mycena polygramma]|nr:hypothetical protein DFH06DRAFT_1154914 [Mycena polygramma]
MVVYVSGPGDHQISGFEYWEVYTGRRAWKWGRTDYTVVHEVSDLRGPKVVVFVAFFDAPHTYHTLVLEVDLVNGKSVELSRLVIDPMPYPDPQLCEDFLILKVLQRGSMLDSEFPAVLLVNWRTKMGFIFDCGDIVSYALFPAHIVLGYASRSVPRTLNLRVYAVASFDDLCIAVGDLTVSMGSRTDFSHIPFIACSIPNTTGSVYLPRTSPQISVTPSALHDATYHCVVQVVIQVVDTVSSTSPPLRPTSLLKRLRSKFKRNVAAPPDIITRLTKKVFHYHLTFPPNAETDASSALPQFHLKSTRHSPKLPRARGAHAEYYLCYNTGHPILIPWARDTELEDGPPVKIPASECPSSVDLTRSGALLEVRQNRVVVSYYQ